MIIIIHVAEQSTMQIAHSSTFARSNAKPIIGKELLRTTSDETVLAVFLAALYLPYEACRPTMKMCNKNNDEDPTH